MKSKKATKARRREVRPRGWEKHPMAQEWYYVAGGVSKGPITIEEVKTLLGSGQLRSSDLLWHDGMDQWTQAAKVEGLVPRQPLTVAPTTPPPSKLIVPFVATNTLKEAKKVNGKVYPKGTQIMVKDGGAYDANGNLISIIK